MVTLKGDEINKITVSNSQAEYYSNLAKSYADSAQESAEQAEEYVNYISDGADSAISQVQTAVSSALETMETTSSAAISAAEGAADIAIDWATKTDGPVEGNGIDGVAEYSAKYYALQAQQFKDEAIASVGDITSSVTAAQTAQTAAEAAKTAILTDADFIAVSDDLASTTSNIKAIGQDLNGENSIGVVSENINTIETVVDNLTTMETLNTNISAIQTANNNIGIITSVNSKITEIETVADNLSTINTINSNMDDIRTANENITAISNVGGNITNINAIANNLSGTNTIGTVANNLQTIEEVGDNIAGINFITQYTDELESIGTDLAGTNTIGTVANNISDVQELNENISAINTVNDNLSNILTVVSNSDKLDNISENMNSIVSLNSNMLNVAGAVSISSDITTVAQNASSIQTIVNNLDIIENAADFVGEVQESFGIDNIKKQYKPFTVNTGDVDAEGNPDYIEEQMSGETINYTADSNYLYVNNHVVSGFPAFDDFMEPVGIQTGINMQDDETNIFDVTGVSTRTLYGKIHITSLPSTVIGGSPESFIFGPFNHGTPHLIRLIIDSDHKLKLQAGVNGAWNNICISDAVLLEDMDLFFAIKKEALNYSIGTKTQKEDDYVWTEKAMWSSYSNMGDSNLAIGEGYKSPDDVIYLKGSVDMKEWYIVDHNNNDVWRAVNEGSVTGIKTKGTIDCSTADGTVYTLSNPVSYNTQNLSDGTYNLYLNPVSEEMTAIDNNIEVGKVFSDSATDGDYLLDISKIPYSLKEKGNSATVPNNIPIGKITKGSDGITCTLNDYNKDWVLDKKLELLKQELLT